MSNHIPLFQFRLSSGQSIGPGMLRRLWAAACSTEDVTVSREIRKLGYGRQGHVYSLCGSPKMADLPNVEVRLRRLLQDNASSATVTLTRLP
jgi:hypothetical protein